MEGDVSTRRLTLTPHGGERPYRFLRSVGSALVYCYWCTNVDESRFNLWDHDDRIRVRRYAVERCLPECVIERHTCLTFGVMVWGAISYHGPPNLLRVEGNLSIALGTSLWC
ncbi:uncharacterized protein TNCV_215551 [Trichonephila clavipes]|nr:uncharacterized protein TNCV_215551 [Trichonephila clavipes]